jgi:hypothetical protein
MANKDVSRLIAWLRDLGFELTKGGKHYRVEHPNHPGWSTVPLSPSDHRWFDNARSQLRSAFPHLDPTTMDTFPGSRGSTRSTLRSQLPGDRIVIVLDELVGARGECPFAGRMQVVDTNGTKTLEIENPFYALGSNAPIRSQRTVEIHLGRGNQELGWAAIAALQDLGVDLELPTLDDLGREFLAFAREQRTMGIAEHKQWQARRRIAGDESIGRPTGRVVPDGGVGR